MKNLSTDVYKGMAISAGDNIVLVDIKLGFNVAVLAALKFNDDDFNYLRNFRKLFYFKLSSNYIFLDSAPKQPVYNAEILRYISEPVFYKCKLIRVLGYNNILISINLGYCIRILYKVSLFSSSEHDKKFNLFKENVMESIMGVTLFGTFIKKVNDKYFVKLVDVTGRDINECVSQGKDVQYEPKLTSNDNYQYQLAE